MQWSEFSESALRGGAKDWSIYAQPIDKKKFMKHKLFPDQRSVLLMAALGVGRSLRLAKLTPHCPIP
jgi:hypothetical protein